MSLIEAVVVETRDPAGAERFWREAFGVRSPVRARPVEREPEGFRGFVMSLPVSQPSVVVGVVDDAVAAGAQVVTPPAKSFWGFGATVRDRCGVAWKIASASKRDDGPAVKKVDEVVLLLGAADVAAGKQFYVDRGVAVAKSFGRKYVEFETAPVKFALYGRRAAAKEAGEPPEGSGVRGLTVVGGLDGVVDPDGVVWEGASAR